MHKLCKSMVLVNLFISSALYANQVETSFLKQFKPIQSLPAATHWISLNTPQSGYNLKTFQVRDNPKIIFAFRHSNEFYRSTDAGNAWEKFSAPDAVNVNALATLRGNELILTANEGIYISKDLGAHWYKTASDNKNNGSIVAISPSLIFLIKNQHFSETYYRSIDEGQTWAQIQIASEQDDVSSIVGRDNVVIFGSNQLNISTDNGVTFKEVPLSSDSYVNALAIDSKQNIYVAQYDGLFKTDLSSSKWHRFAYVGTPYEVQVDANDNIYLLSAREYENSRLLKSSDDGNTWQELFSAPEMHSLTLLTDGKVLVTTEKGVFTSDSAQLNFKPVTGPFKGLKNFNVFEIDKTHLLSIQAINTDSPNLMFRSEDAGKTWVQVNVENPISVTSFKGKLILNNAYTSLLTSDDTGATWKPLSALPDYMHRLRSYGSALIGEGITDAYITSDLVHWRRFTDGWLRQGQGYFANNVLYLGKDHKILASTDRGTTWTTLYDKFTDATPFIRGYQDKVLLAIDNGYGIYKSIDAGKTWQNINNNLTDFTFNDVCVINATTYLAATADKVFVTHNGGNSWVTMTDGLINQEISEFYLNKDYLLARSRYNGIFQAV